MWIICLFPTALGGADDGALTCACLKLVPSLTFLAHAVVVAFVVEAPVVRFTLVLSQVATGTFNKEPRGQSGEKKTNMKALCQRKSFPPERKLCFDVSIGLSEKNIINCVCRRADWPGRQSRWWSHGSMASVSAVAFPLLRFLLRLLSAAVKRTHTQRWINTHPRPIRSVDLPQHLKHGS